MSHFPTTSGAHVLIKKEHECDYATLLPQKFRERARTRDNNEHGIEHHSSLSLMYICPQGSSYSGRLRSELRLVAVVKLGVKEDGDLYQHFDVKLFLLRYLGTRHPAVKKIVVGKVKVSASFR